MKKVFAAIAVVLAIASGALADNVIVLGNLTRNTTITTDTILTGTLSATPRPKISIANGVRVTLSGATIMGDDNHDYLHVDKWAGITCLGDATIILVGDNHVTGYDECPAIYVPQNHTLTIDGSGSLEATGGKNGTLGSAGIGGETWRSCGNIEINGGTITAKGYGACAGIGGSYRYSCGYITINGGDVNAESEHSAGIGTGGITSSDGSNEEGSDCGHITITGGRVTAKGAAGAAAIGTGRDGRCGDITISGGTVVVRGIAGGAGIGTGINGYCGVITIDGGVVSATSLEASSLSDVNDTVFCGAAIGAGDYGRCGTIEIKGGIVSAKGGSNAAAIGTGIHGSCPNIYVRSGVSRLTVEKDKSSGSTWLGRGKECDSSCWALVDNTALVLAEDELTRVYTWNGDLSTCNADMTVFNGMRLTGTLSGNYKLSIEDNARVMLDGVTINGANSSSCRWAGLTCLGNAELRLAAGSVNTVRGFHQDYPGIYVPEGSLLTIAGPGSLTASSTGRGAGIGGGYAIHCGSIDLRGGTITATGGTGCAGIGGGQSARSGDISIYSGIIRVVATGGSGAAPVGIGNRGAGNMPYVADGLSSVTSGNTRTITPTWDGNLNDLNNYAVAYDGMTITGTLHTKSKITIAAGATVTLKSATIMVDGVENDTSCNWAGLNCLGNATIILEGNNDIRGFYKDWPGIYVPPGSTLTIKGSGWLQADSNGRGAGIGGGWNIDCGNITIESGYVDAEGGDFGAAGIGGGHGASCGTIRIRASVARVRAVSSDAPNPIGKGEDGTGGTVVVDSGTKDTLEYDGTQRTIVWDGDLSLVSGDVTAISGTTIRGTNYGDIRPHKISIAAGATVTLNDACIYGADYNYCRFAGLTCEGNATIILKGYNLVRGFQNGHPGIYVPPGRLLTIKGGGSLAAYSNGFGAGIGGGWGIACGDILIEGGSIVAVGGAKSAGIGGGSGAACGNIRIDSGITHVSATCGDDCDKPIGKGTGGSGGSVSVASSLYDVLKGTTRTIVTSRVNLAMLESDFTALDGMTLYGTLWDHKLSIAAGATVAISNVCIDTVSEGDWSGITCLGNATIVLQESNEVAGSGEHAGIYVPWDSTLTISGDGSLVACGGGESAGIGGGAHEDGGIIVIEGGYVEATGGSSAAGIGSGFYCSCRGIEIRGGIVNANSNNCGAGIGSGGGGNCGYIVISGGVITADGDARGVGIGSGGDSGRCGDIVISGGDITATGGDWSPGIGSSAYGSTCGNISIEPGITYVRATRGSGCQDFIGAAVSQSTCGTVTISAELRQETLGDTLYIWPVAWDGNLDSLNGHGYVVATNGVTISGTLSSSADYKIGISAGATVTLSNATIRGRSRSDCKWAGITCYGDATIVLVGDNIVKGFYSNYPGIYVPPGCTLTIMGTGYLNATSNGWAPGIGAAYSMDCGNIVIKGGDIKSSGGLSSAGIGGAGGYRSSCGDIVIEKTAGRVIAQHGDGCENNIGAGGAMAAQCGEVTVEPGLSDVTSSDGESRTIQWDGDLSTLDFDQIAYRGTVIHGTLAARCKVSIDKGQRVIVSNATIVIDNVGADMSYKWAGLTCIGSADITLKGNNTIQGFYEDYPGIFVPKYCTLTINGDGSLTARGSVGSGNYRWAPGIGGGYSIPGGSVVVKGGTIDALGGRYAAGIGGGRYALCGSIHFGAGIDRVTATCGDYCSNPIGAGGDGGTGGVVTKAAGLLDDGGTTTRTISSWWDGNLAAVTDDMAVPDGMTLYGTLGGNHKLTIEDGAHIILKGANINQNGQLSGDWAGLTCEGWAQLVIDETGGSSTVRGFGSGYPGIYVPEGEFLMISGSGTLYAYGAYRGAGIGAGSNIDDGNCGDIEITDCILHAQGGFRAAGIGGTSEGECGYILVDYCDVYARGGSYAPGIGSGDGGTCLGIEFDHAQVVAEGGNGYAAAGIGAGDTGYCDSVLIDKDCEINATGGANSPGIGAGPNAACGDIDILYGIRNVVATCGSGCSTPIFTGDGDDSGVVSVAPGLLDDGGTPTRTITSWNGDLSELTGNVTIPNGMTVYGTMTGKYKVSIANRAKVTISNATIEVSSANNKTYYNWAGLNCIGDAEITLVGNNAIRGFYEDQPGIYVPSGKTLTINGDGLLTAYSNGFGAGIGGGYTNSCGNITIDGGTIMATGGGSAAGIGAGYKADCGTITIVGGTITATGGGSAAGIGAGYQGICDEVVIGSRIERIVATHGSGGVEAIGAGKDGTCYNYPTIPAGLIDDNGNPTRTIYRWNGDLAALTTDVTIPNGMTVYGTLQGKYKVSIDSNSSVTLSNATIVVENVGRDESCKWAGLTCKLSASITLVGNNTIQGFHEDYPGIYVPEDCRLTIKGNGSLTARGSVGTSSKRWAAGIGGGYELACGDIVIQGGTITAIGGSSAAGIGSGYNAACGDISITGGSVAATGGENAAGIGTGRKGTCNSIYIGPGITRVEATRGTGAIYTIGIGASGTCGTPEIDSSLLDDNGDPTRTITSASAADPLAAYKAWATANGVSGAWDYVDANGIANVFRYAFNRPTGAFPMITDITFENGYAVIVTQMPEATSGFVFTIVASANPDGTGAEVEHALDPSGVTVIGETLSEKRFFRLKAVIDQ